MQVCILRKESAKDRKWKISNYLLGFCEYLEIILTTDLKNPSSFLFLSKYVSILSPEKIPVVISFCCKGKIEKFLSSSGQIFSYKNWNQLPSESQVLCWELFVFCPFNEMTRRLTNLTISGLGLFVVSLRRENIRWLPSISVMFSCMSNVSSFFQLFYLSPLLVVGEYYWFPNYYDDYNCQYHQVLVADKLQIFSVADFQNVRLYFLIADSSSFASYLQNFCWRTLCFHEFCWDFPCS